jgi:hypothetical protein
VPIPNGARATIAAQKLMAHLLSPSRKREADEGYSVEFFDMTGNTVAVVTVPASALRLPTPADRPAVRALSA